MDTTTLVALVPTGLLLLALVGGAAVFATDGARVIAFPYPMDYGEGPLLAQTRALANRENIYRADLTSPPYTISNYPPIYPLVLSPVARVARPAFWYGRLLSWVSIAAAATLIGLIAHALTGDRLAAVIGGLLLLAFPPASYWAGLFRVDPLALALSLGGLYVCVRRPAGRWTVPLAASCSSRRSSRASRTVWPPRSRRRAGCSRSAAGAAPWPWSAWSPPWARRSSPVSSG